MTFTMTVSPDFSPKHMAGWYIFNTWLQKRTELSIHLKLYDSFDAQRNDIANDKIDLIYANPYDASMLIREKGFMAVAAPKGKSDEAMICVPDDSAIQHVEDLQPGCRVAMANDQEVNTIGMIMLEPADLSADNINQSMQGNYVMVAKQLLNDKADAGFFLEEGYRDMSKFLQNQIRPIVGSQISVIKHVFLVGPRLAEKLEDIRALLLDMKNAEKGSGVLASLRFDDWENQTQEDVEFMIDLMDTLSS